MRERAKIEEQITAYLSIEGNPAGAPGLQLSNVLQVQMLEILLDMRELMKESHQMCLDIKASTEDPTGAMERNGAGDHEAGHGTLLRGGQYERRQP